MLYEFRFYVLKTMKSQELAALAGVTTQWLNKLLDRRGIPGVRRNAKGRLEIFDEDEAAKWASQRSRPKKKARRAQNRDPWQDFIDRGRSFQSREARASIHIACAPVSFGVRSDKAGWSVPNLAKELGLSKQGIYQAIARLDKSRPGVRRVLLFRYDESVKRRQGTAR